MRRILTSVDKLNPYDIDYPMIVFEGTSVYVDEMWDIDEEGRISISSYQNGIVEYKDGQYVEYFHSSKRNIGQFVRIEFDGGVDVPLSMEEFIAVLSYYDERVANARFAMEQAIAERENYAHQRAND